MLMAFVVVFWIWTVFSVGILVRRSALKRRGKATRRRAELDVELAAALRLSAPPARFEPTAPAPPYSNRREIVDAEIVVEPAPAAEPEAAQDGPLRALPAATTPRDEGPGVVDEVQPPAARRAGEYADRGERSGIRTLTDVMAGFRMPCGLTPLIAQDSLRITEQAAFVTAEATPEIVGGSIADELERLGMQVRSISDDTAIAQGPNGSLQIQIFITGPAVNGRTHERFPTAPPHSVIVQFALS